MPCLLRNFFEGFAEFLSQLAAGNLVLTIQIIDFLLSLMAQAVRCVVEEQSTVTVMDVRDAAGRWDALSSRDSSSRNAAMELIHQEVLKKIESIGPMPDPQCSSPPPAIDDSLSSDLNALLAHVLMLSKRCPYEDVREKCICLLQRVQVGILKLN